MRTSLSLLALLLATACTSGSLVVDKPTDLTVNREVDAMWIRDIRRVARSGDWILSRSYSMTGDMVTATTIGESLSHASIYDAERGTIIEAINPVVREVPLESLVARNRYLVVVRPSGLTERQQLASVARARAQVGAAFDYGGLFGFDDPAEFYCSELVAWAANVRHGEVVVSPANLFDLGEAIYFSGARDDQATQRAAAASRELVAERERADWVRVAAAR